MRLETKTVLREFHAAFDAKKFRHCVEVPLIPYTSIINARLVAISHHGNAAVMFFDDGKAYVLRSLPEHPLQAAVAHWEMEKLLKGRGILGFRYDGRHLLIRTDDNIEHKLYKVDDEPWLVDYSAEIIYWLIDSRLKGNDMEHFCVAQACDELSGKDGFPCTGKSTIESIYERAREVLDVGGRNLEKLAGHIWRNMLHNYYVDTACGIYLMETV